MTSIKKFNDRPFIFLSVATSLDGQIATIHGDTKLSNSKDWKRVHRLRAESDAILVGSGTIRSDDSKLTINEEIIDVKVEKHPIRVVVSSDGNIPLNARVITFQPEILTIIATTSRCSRERRHLLEKKGCSVLICGDGPRTNLHHLFSSLKTNYSIRKLMVEGGSQLNGELLRLNLIDEVHLAIAPVVCGKGVPLLTLDKNIRNFSKSPFFEIKTHEKIGDMIWLKMSVHYQSREIL
ncbi:MAG: RibD family protein [Candidatus Hodarchaeales archaeon]